MIKMLACICFLLGSCGYGCIKVREYRKRCDELIYIRYILNTMLLETENRRGTFGETCLVMSGKLRQPYREIFQGLYDLLERERTETPKVYWENKIKELAKLLLLKKEEIHILQGIIRCADGTTLSMPMEVLRDSLSEWDRVIYSARQVQKEKSKVTLCLSIAVGLLLCITVI